MADTTNATDRPAPAGLAAEVADEVHPALKAIGENIKPILVIIVIFLLGLGGYQVVRSHMANQRKAAEDDLGRIELLADAGEKRQALEVFLTEGPSDLKQGVLFELIGACMDLGDYDAALGYWDQLERPEGTDLGVIADLGKAKTLSLAGRNEEALALLDSLRSTAPEAFDSSIVRLTATIAEAAGDLARAKAAFEELYGMGSGESPYLEFKIARLAKLLEDQG